MKTPIKEFTVSALELADLLVLTDRTIRRLAEAGTIPPATKNRFGLREGVRGYVLSLRQRKDAPKLEDAKRRRAECLAQMAELDLRERKGSLIPVPEMSARLSPMLICMRQVILGSELSYDEQGVIFEALEKCKHDALCGPTPEDQPDDETTQINR
jgi:hypothetical protein